MDGASQKGSESREEERRIKERVKKVLQSIFEAKLLLVKAKQKGMVFIEN